MNDQIVANLNHAIDDFMERASRACAYRGLEWLRENEIDVLAENGVETWREEQLATVMEDRIRDVFYELFEIQRAEDASCTTDDVLKGGLFGIQRTLEQIERRLLERRSVVRDRELPGSREGGHPYPSSQVHADGDGKDGA
jgi:hypothetical protein